MKKKLLTTTRMRNVNCVHVRGSMIEKMKVNNNFYFLFVSINCLNAFFD